MFLEHIYIIWEDRKSYGLVWYTASALWKKFYFNLESLVLKVK